MVKRCVSEKKWISLSDSYIDTVIKYHLKHNLVRGKKQFNPKMKDIGSPRQPRKVIISNKSIYISQNFSG